jgi:hypothetical protein
MPFSCSRRRQALDSGPATSADAACKQQYQGEFAGQQSHGGVLQIASVFIHDFTDISSDAGSVLAESRHNESLAHKDSSLRGATPWLRQPADWINRLGRPLIP